MTPIQNKECCQDCINIGYCKPPGCYMILDCKNLDCPCHHKKTDEVDSSQSTVNQPTESWEDEFLKMMKDIELRRKFDWKAYQILMEERPIELIKSLLSSHNSQLKEEIEKMIEADREIARVRSETSSDSSYRQGHTKALIKVLKLIK